MFCLLTVTLYTFQCVLLACIAIVTAEDLRPKRDLLYLKNLLTSKIFGNGDIKSDSTPVLLRQDGEAKIFRIPGFNNILVKAIPKANVKKIETQENIEVIEHPTIAILKSYLGTKTQGDTLSALQGIKNLLTSGILNAQNDLLEIVSVQEPCLPKPAVIADPPEASVIPVLPPTIIPVVPVFPINTKYSYKQTLLNGHMTTYTSKDGHDVLVSETNGPVPQPPPYILDRLQQVLVFGIKPVQAIASVVPKPVFHLPKPIAAPVPIPTIQAPSGDLHVNTYSYKQNHHDGGVTIYSGSGQTSVLKDQKEYQQLPKKIEEVRVSTPVQLSTNVPQSGYRFKIGNNANYSDNLAGRWVFNIPSYYESPQHTTRYVYKQINPNTPDMIYVEDKPRFDSKGEVHVNVYNGNSKEYSQPPYLSKKINPGFGEFSYKQHHNDGSITTYTENNIGSSVVKPTIQMIPFVHAHNTDSIENSAYAHEAPIAKLLSTGYSYKTVNGKNNLNIANNQGMSTDQKDTNFQIGTQGVPAFGRYSYKQVNSDGSSVVHMHTGVKSLDSLPAQISPAEKLSPGYSFQMVNNQALFGENGANGHSNIAQGSINLAGADGVSKDKSPLSTEAYSYKQMTKEGSSTIYTGTVKKPEETTAIPSNSVAKKSSAYSFKIFNGNTREQPHQNVGMSIFNTNKADSELSNKKSNNDGSLNTYMAAAGSNEHSLGTQTNPAQIAPTGFSFKIVNNQAYFGNNDQNKIGSAMVKDISALHTHNTDGIENSASAHEAPIAKLLSGYSFKTENGKAYMSTSYASNEANSNNQESSPVTSVTYGATEEGEAKKSIPVLPAHIANRIVQIAAPGSSAGRASSGYSFQIVNGLSKINSNDGQADSVNRDGSYGLSGSGAYSYKLVNNAGSLTSYVSKGEGNKSNLLVREIFKPIPASPEYVVKSIENAAVHAQAANSGPSRYSFKLVNNQESNIEGNNQNDEMESSPVAYKINEGGRESSNFQANNSSNSNDATNTDVGHTGSKNDVRSSGYSFKLVNSQAFSSDASGQALKPHEVGSGANEGIHGASSFGAFSFKLNGNAGTTLKNLGIKEENSENSAYLKIYEPALPTTSADKVADSFNIVNNIQGINANKNSERKGEKQEAFMFTEPIPSKYMYQQINTNNQQPMTVVRVEDRPAFESNADVTFRVNMHEHINSDGTRYLCDERHLYGPELAEHINTENVSKVQKGLMFIPPTVGNDMMQMKDETESTKDNTWKNNPIVVAPDHDSFNQTNTNGSLYKVDGGVNAVSVNVDVKETTENLRGDI